MTFAIVFLATLLLFADRVFAAEFLFTAPAEIKTGQSFELSISLKTDSEALNAVSGEVIFPTDLLEFDSIKNGNSIVSFWVEPPHVESDRIVFSGIIPGGYVGDDGWLFSISLVPKNVGSGEVSFAKTLAFLNDGQGTETPVSTVSLPLTILPPGEVTPTDPVIKDTVEPELFKAEISATPDIYDGAYFLAFMTQDKGSGIDHYEVSESRIKQLGRFFWKTATTPYRLDDQELKSHIMVKAVDKAGNTRLVAVAPTHSLAWYENAAIWSIILFIASIIIIIYIAWRNIVRQKK